MQIVKVETSVGVAISRRHRARPHAAACAVHVAMNVFDRHRRVVHQDADGQSESAQRHGIHRLAHRAENDDRAEDREWNGDRDDQRAAPAAQKEQDHQRRKSRGNHAFAQDPYDRGLDEDRLIEEFGDIQPFGAAAREHG